MARFSSLLLALLLPACGQHQSQSSGYLQSSGTYQGEKPNTPEAVLAHIIETGDLAALRAKLEEGADKNMRLIQNRTLLIHATIQQKAALMAELLDRKADQNLVDDSGKTALAHSQDMGFVKGWILLDPEKEASENAQLLKYVKRRSSQKVEELLRNGANPNFTDENGQPLLHLAIEQLPTFPGAMNVIEILVRWQDPDQLNSIDLKKKSSLNETPFALAQRLDLKPVIELLNSLGVNE